MGALAYTFSDTFWFSAVEGEVYAFSSFLTALVSWMILRWQDEPHTRFMFPERTFVLETEIVATSVPFPTVKFVQVGDHVKVPGQPWGFPIYV